MTTIKQYALALNEATREIVNLHTEIERLKLENSEKDFDTLSEFGFYEQENKFLRNSIKCKKKIINSLSHQIELKNALLEKQCEKIKALEEKNKKLQEIADDFLSGI